MIPFFSLFRKLAGGFLTGLLPEKEYNTAGPANAKQTVVKSFCPMCSKHFSALTKAQEADIMPQNRKSDSCFSAPIYRIRVPSFFHINIMFVWYHQTMDSERGALHYGRAEEAHYQRRPAEAAG